MSNLKRIREQILENTQKNEKQPEKNIRSQYLSGIDKQVKSLINEIAYQSEKKRSKWFEQEIPDEKGDGTRAGKCMEGSDWKSWFYGEFKKPNETRVVKCIAASDKQLGKQKKNSWY